MREFIKKQFIVIFFVGLFLLKVPLIFQGHLFSPDEERYLRSLQSVEAFTHGNWKEAIGFWFSSSARPGFVIAGLLPAVGQYFMRGRYCPADFLFRNIEQTSLDPIAPAFFDVVSFFNILVVLGICGSLYRLLRRFVEDRRIVFTMVLAYALLCNTNLYIRHLFPYDYALLLFLMAIEIQLAKPSSFFWRVFLSGGLTALGFACYPGYYLLAVIPWGLMILDFFKNQKRILPVFFFASGFLLPILALEGLSWICGVSYLRQAAELSGTVIQGDFHNAFVFFSVYLWRIEGLIGLLLFGLFLAGVFLSMHRGTDTRLRVMLILIVLCYLYYALMAAGFQKMVFYGRLLHMYVPFLTLGAGVCLARIRSTRLKNITINIIILSSVVSFFSYAPQYYRLRYPRDFRYPVIKTLPNSGFWGIVSHQIPFSLSRYAKFPVLFVDAWYHYPVSDSFFEIPQQIEGFELFDETRHPQEFLAYQFEGLSEKERERLAKRDYQMRIYIRKDAWAWFQERMAEIRE